MDASINLETAINTFVNSVCVGKTNETPKAYRGKLQHLLRFWGAEKKIEHVVVDDFENFKSYLYTRQTKNRGGKIIKGQLSPFTIYTVMSTARHFLRWSYRKGYISCDITDSVVIPPPPLPDPKPISPETVDKMLQAAAETGELWERYRNIALIFVLRDTGGRVGGLVNAEVDDLDLATGRLLVKEKGNTTRFIYLSEATKITIMGWLSVRYTLDPKDHHLFLNSLGYGFGRGGIYSALRRLAVKANASGRYNPHAFRHAFARDALMNGADLSQVSQMMGHSKVTVTADYYARWADKELKDIHRRVSPGAKMLPITPAVF